MYRRFHDDRVPADGPAGGPRGHERRGLAPRRRAPEDPWAAVRREIDRSRRHAHQVALLRLAAPGRERHDRHALTRMAGALGETLRGVDSVWVEHDAVFVLLPESGRAAAEGLLARLPAIAAATRVSLGCFPEDGLTANALRAAVARGDGAPHAVRADRAALRAAAAPAPSEEAAG